MMRGNIYIFLHANIIQQGFWIVGEVLKHLPFVLCVT